MTADVRVATFYELTGILLDSAGINGQTFNNPTRQRWPAIFWPGYTAGLHWKRHGAATCPSK